MLQLQNPIRRQVNDHCLGLSTAFLTYNHPGVDSRATVEVSKIRITGVGVVRFTSTVILIIIVIMTIIMIMEKTLKQIRPQTSLDYCSS